MEEIKSNGEIEGPTWWQGGEEEKLKGLSVAGYSMYRRGIEGVILEEVVE